MDKLSSRIRLLWLLCILFIYFIIRSLLENDTELAIFWTLFLILYIISLIIMHIVFRTLEKRAEL